MSSDALRGWLSQQQRALCSCDHCMPIVNRSPIEVMLENALAYVHDGMFTVAHCEWPVLTYDADFYVEALGRKFVIECDGHDFHERTKEQAEHDKKRDRAMTSAGYIVLRFAGREIYRNPFACANQVIDAAISIDILERFGGGE